jgi:hypothetical protein
LQGTAIRWFCLWVAGVLALTGPVIPARGAAEPPPIYTAEQKTALDVLDGVIARFETLLAQDDDAAHHAATKARIEEFKARCEEIRATYDQARYDELRVDLNLEYQRLASWLAPAKTPPPDDKAKRR